MLNENQSQGMAPSELEHFLQDHPVLTSPSEGWKNLVLQRFTDVSNQIDIPAMRDDVFVCHLRGPFVAETDSGTRGFRRQWISSGFIGVNPAGIPVRRLVRGKPDVVLVHSHVGALGAVAEEMFDVAPERIALVPILGEKDEAAHLLMRLLMSEAENNTLGVSLMVETLSRALLVHAIRRYSNVASRCSPTQATISPGRVRKVIEYMQAHVEQEISLAQLAEIGGLSVSRFSRAFRGATGQPPYRFLVDLRIRHARHLLEETDLPITQVALRCGFDQPSHFAAMFQKTMGMSPRTWRAQNRE